MWQRIWLASFFFALSSCIATAASADGLQWLAKETDVLKAGGYDIDGANVELDLGASETKEIPLNLDVNYRYLLIAACGAACGAVHVEIRDQAGNPRISTPESRELVILEPPLKAAGPYSIFLSVPGCSRAQCHLTFSLLKKRYRPATSPPPQTLQVAVPEAKGDAIGNGRPAAASTGDEGLRKLAFNKQQNYDLFGGDLLTLRDTAQDICEKSCGDRQDCVGYSYDRWNRWCYLKRELKELRIDPRSISAVRADKAQPQISNLPIAIERYHNKAFFEEGRIVAGSRSGKECEQSCVSANNCVAYTFLRTKSSCRIFATVGEYKSDPDSDSGSKRQ